MFKIFKKTKNLIKDLVFPKKCAGCKKEGVWLCKNCQKEIVPIKTFTCPKCKTITKNGQVCSSCRKNSNLTGMIIAAYFRGPLRELVHTFKYNGVKDLAEILVNLLISRLYGRLPRGRILLISMPLHFRKKAERGFNQTEILARLLSEKLHLEYRNNILKRKKYTRPQIGLESRDRLKNIAGAFEINKKIEKEILKNRTILLLDDVITTGATLEEAAKTLRIVGAKRIWGITVAQG